MKHFLNQMQSKHMSVVDYFLANGFGTNMLVLTYLSGLSPVDRCIILEILFECGVRNIHLYDKMVLAYVKVGRPDLGKEVIRLARENGEEEDNCWAIELKLDLGIPPARTNEQRIAIFENYLETNKNPKEIEFLNILIEFVRV